MFTIISQYTTYGLLKLECESHLMDTVASFIYNTIKIFFLLLIIILVISIIRSYSPPEKTRRILSYKKEFIGIILTALLGVKELIRDEV